MLLEWAAGNLAKKRWSIRTWSRIQKTRCVPPKKEPCKEKSAAFKPCHVLWMSCIPPPPPPSSPSSFAAFCLRPMARFPLVQLLGGKVSQVPRHRFDRWKQQRGRPFPGGTGRTNGDKQWRNGKTKVIWLICLFGNLFGIVISLFLQCFISKIDVACSNAALMKIHTLSKKGQQEIDGGGVSSWHHKRLPSNVQMYSDVSVFTNLWCSIHI